MVHVQGSMVSLKHTATVRLSIYALHLRCDCKQRMSAAQDLKYTTHQAKPFDLNEHSNVQHLQCLHNPPFPVFVAICLFTTLVPQDVCRASWAIVLPDVNFDALANTFGIIAHESAPICPIWSLWLGPCRPSVIETLRDSARQGNKWEDCSLQKQCHYIFTSIASELICMIRILNIILSEQWHR